MKTTFSRTLISLAVILLTALLIIGLAFQFLIKDYLEDRAMDSLKKDCAALAKLASAYHYEDSLTSRNFLINLSVLSQLSDSDAVICDTNGKLIVCSRDPFGCEHQGLVIGQNYLNKVLQSEYVTSTGSVEGIYNDVRYVASCPIYDAENNPIGIVISSTPITATATVMRRLSDTFLLVSFFTLILAAVVSTFYARKHSHPLREMSRAAIAFGHGNLKARVKIPPSAPEEVQELALAFNNMAVSLEKSEYRRQEFVANISHELKTPMTTIGGYVDGILDGTIPPEQQDHYLQIVSGETKRLSRLVRSMLDISRLQEQGGFPEESKTRFEVSESIGQVLITFEQKILSKQLNVDVDFPNHPLYTFACQDAITQVLYNLTDNAVKFCPNAGNLVFSLKQKGNKAYITVANDGQTIPPEELSLLFDRFHKLDKSRSENRDGWGLGLYIVKTIICSHGEDISVTSKDGFTEFTFTLPIVN